MASPIRTPVTSDKALFTFYDIESLSNVFTLCTFSPRRNVINAFYLIDDDGSEAAAMINNGTPPAHSIQPTLASKTILENNPAFNDGEILFHNLRTWEANLALARIMGLSDSDYVNNPSAESSYSPELRPVCDTDAEYDPINKHPYLVGYNSNNYDTVIAAMYLNEAFHHAANAEASGVDPAETFRIVKASKIREYNDQLFTDRYKKYMPKFLTDQDGGWSSTPHKIRRAMLHSGRHLDAARFNEVQQMVGLKRLLGGLGRQIMESDKLGGHNSRVESVMDFCELLAYNVSDVVGLAKLFEHPTYASGFDLKKALIDEYPDTVYQQKRNGKGPDISPRAVRRDRLTPDASSAKLAATILAPYKPLVDMEAVSFLYPEKSVAEARGVQQVNVLEESKKFFEDNITDPVARAQFYEVYEFYKSIEGRNFNESGSDEKYNKEGSYRHHYSGGTGNLPEHLEPISLKDIPKRPNNIPYFHADGTPSKAFATFSTGGIHGAEADWAAWEADAASIRAFNEYLDEAESTFEDPLALWDAKEFMTHDGTLIPRKELLTAKTRKRDLEAMRERLAEVTEPAERQRIMAEEFEGIGYRPHKPLPLLFEEKPDGSNKLKAKYTFTSASPAIHEDFTSYYPNLLRGMNAFYNPDLGEDRYTKIFFDKERYGAERKDPTKSPEERNRLDVLRNGTKLILNAASGAGDASHDNNIRMNNVIISMRVLGQLFSWRIGQAQTLAGATIISTNTDGLYSTGLDRETNDRILAEQAEATGVEIEPEPMIVVSKDSNNRLELDEPEEGQEIWEAKIVGASGGSLACHKEPQPTKSLAHPAVLDWALARYLRYIVGGYTPSWRSTPLSLDEPLDMRVGKELMRQAVRENEPVLAARLFQYVVSASVGSITFPFAADPVTPDDVDSISNPRALQHYSRCFIVHENKPGAVSLRSAGSWKVTAASQAKRARDQESSVQDHPVAKEILKANGYSRKVSDKGTTLIPRDEDTAVRKVSGIEPHWNVLIDNGDLVEKPEAEIKSLLGCLELDIYVEMLASAFNANWKRTEK